VIQSILRLSDFGATDLSHLQGLRLSDFWAAALMLVFKGVL